MNISSKAKYSRANEKSEQDEWQQKSKEKPKEGENHSKEVSHVCRMYCLIIWQKQMRNDRTSAGQSH